MLAANALALLVAESSRGLVLASLYAYLKAVAPGSPGAALGYAVAAFSAGRLASSYALAALVDGAGWTFAGTLRAALALQAFGHVLYVLPNALGAGSGATALLVASRAVIGFGSGTLPTCRAVVAGATSTAERTRQLGVLSLAKYLGYAICPGIGAVLSFTIPLPLLGARFDIDPFTAPAWLSVLLCGLGAAAVSRTFPAYDASAATSSGGGGGSPVPAGPPPAGLAKAVDPPPLVQQATAPAPRCRSEPLAWLRALLCGPHGGSRAQLMLAHAAVLFFLLNLVTKGALAVAETSLAPQYEAAGGATDSGTDDGGADDGGSSSSGSLVRGTALFSLGLGLAGFGGYILLAVKPPQAVPQSERLSLSSVSDPGAPPPAASDVDTAPLLQHSSQHTNPWSLRSWHAWAARHALWLDSQLLLASLACTAVGAAFCVPLGAPVGLPRLSLGMALVWSVGAPIADVLAVSCYSVLLSRFRGSAATSQASAMGAVSAAGSMGRIAYPPLVSLLTLAGCWAATAATCAAAAASTWLFFAAYPEAAGGQAPHDSWDAPLRLLRCWKARVPAAPPRELAAAYDAVQLELPRGDGQQTQALLSDAAAAL